VCIISKIYLHWHQFWCCIILCNYIVYFHPSIVSVYPIQGSRVKLSQLLISLIKCNSTIVDKITRKITDIYPKGIRDKKKPKHPTLCYARYCSSICVSVACLCVLTHTGKCVVSGWVSAHWCSSSLEAPWWISQHHRCQTQGTCGMMFIIIISDLSYRPFHKHCICTSISLFNKCHVSGFIANWFIYTLLQH
jgi:hypothetical protein